MGSQVRRLHEDFLFEFLEVEARLETGLGQDSTESLVGTQRFDTSTFHGQRRDQQIPESFPVRMIGDSCLEESHSVGNTAECQVGFQAEFHGADSHLVETPGLEVHELIVVEVSEWRPSPQPQCLHRQFAGSCRISVEGVGCLHRQSLESDRIDRLRRNRQDVSTLFEHDVLGAEAFPQIGDMRLQRGVRSGRRIVTPHSGYEIVGRHRMADPQHQRSQDGSGMATGNRPTDTSSSDFDGAQHTNEDHSTARCTRWWVVSARGLWPNWIYLSARCQRISSRSEENRKGWARTCQRREREEP